MTTATTSTAARVPSVPEERADLALRVAGTSLLASALLSVLGYVILGSQFGWPDVLDQPGTTALDAFVAAETAARIGFTVFVFSSLALIPAAVAVGELMRAWGSLATTLVAFGALAGFAQVLGWVRWPLVLPGLADAWVAAEGDRVERTALASSYDLLNAYGGGALGEHLGWLLQAIWAVGVAVWLVRARVTARWFAWTGLVLSVVWGALVPVATSARLDAVEFWGLNVYTAWYVWTLALGVQLLRRR